MPTSCCAFGCTNNSLKPDCIERKVSFHNFPHNDKYLMKAWLVKIRRQGFVPKQNTKLCSDHFEAKYFFPSRGTKRLEKDAIPTIFSFWKTSKRKTVENIRDKNNALTMDDDSMCDSPLNGTGRLIIDETTQFSDDSQEFPTTLTPDDAPTKTSPINGSEKLCNDEMNDHSDDSQEFPVVEVETILTEDPHNSVVVPPEKAPSPKYLKNYSSCQILEDEIQRISALKNKLMSTSVKRSMKRNFLELKIKIANAKRDLYEQKKLLLPFRSTVTNSDPFSSTEKRLIETLKDEEFAFNIEKKYLKKQLVEAESKAATSVTTYYEMKKSSL